MLAGRASFQVQSTYPALQPAFNASGDDNRW
jgi:hypothetical protein